MTTTPIEARADFTAIRYAQCWEDADVLLAAMAPLEDRVVVTIASAGDNALALLAGGARRVVAVDLSPAQLCCLELRVAAYRRLGHGELLALVGSRDATAAERTRLFERCRPDLGEQARRFWDARPRLIAAGIGAAGRFEGYFAHFRRLVLPLVHSRRTVASLLTHRPEQERHEFYDRHWDTWRWRALFRLFFSRKVMAALGRDPAFFAYVEGSVAGRILERTRYALRQIDPSTNPYLHWILTGRHGESLPHALREESFELIRNRLDRLEWHCGSLESYLARTDAVAADGFNLSDVFEYMSEHSQERLLRQILGASRAGARLVYWNMLVPRERPACLSSLLVPRTDIASPLFARDRAFFYSRLVVEEVTG